MDSVNSSDKIKKKKKKNDLTTVPRMGLKFVHITVSL